MSRSPDSRKFQDLWSLMREGNDLVPLRSSLRPAAFKDFLARIAIVEIDAENKAMPIRLAGTAICEFVGFELTGKDFLDYHSNAEPGWSWRLKYHDHPCGRYEELLMTSNRHLKVDCALTHLPMTNAQNTRFLLTLFEPTITKQTVLNDTPAMLSGSARAAEFIDIGAGIPD